MKAVDLILIRSCYKNNRFSRNQYKDHYTPGYSKNSYFSGGMTYLMRYSYLFYVNGGGLGRD